MLSTVMRAIRARLQRHGQAGADCGELADELGCTRLRIWRAVRALCSSGRVAPDPRIPGVYRRNLPEIA
jgi:hypothetical protein